MPRIAALCLVLVASAGSAAPFEAQKRVAKPEHVVVKVYASTPWYVERTEKEQILEGVLRKREGAVGPGARGGLNFALESKGVRLPVYSSGADEKLAPFVGRTVRVRGKLVDLAKEGFGKELWIGTVYEVLNAKPEKLPK